METFILILANDKQSHRVEAASWTCSDGHQLTSFDETGEEINSWSSNEWYRLIEQTETGKTKDRFVNPHVPNPMHN